MFTLADQTAVKTMLEANGIAVTHQSRGSERYDRDLGQPVLTENSQDVYGIITSYRTDEIDGHYIISSDKRLALPGDMEPAPKVGDTVSIAGVLWEINTVDPVQPGSICLTYKTGIRKRNDQQ